MITKKDCKYHRTSHACMKNGYVKNQNPAAEISSYDYPKIMNTHALEFVPRKTQPTTVASEDSKVTIDVHSSTRLNNFVAIGFKTKKKQATILKAQTFLCNYELVCYSFSLLVKIVDTKECQSKSC